MVPTKAITPHIPVSVSEIVEQTHEAYEVGITIAHLHARDEDESASWRPELYQSIFEGVRKYCPDLIICGSTSGRKFPEFEKRSAVIELQPDMCSLTLSSLNFLNQASLNSPSIIIKLAEKMKEFGVIPELECFDLGMINFGNYLIKKGIVEGPYYWNLLFDNIAGFQSKFSHFSTAINEIPTDHRIAMGGLGAAQLETNAAAIAMGYNVRVGLEDNIWWDKERTKKARNIDLVKRVHELIQINQKEFMSGAELRKSGFHNRKVSV